jgi:CRP-like cAMP-binding protein
MAATVTEWLTVTPARTIGVVETPALFVAPTGEPSATVGVIRDSGTVVLTDVVRGSGRPMQVVRPTRRGTCQDDGVAAQLFDVLGPETARALREAGERRRFRRREVLFREGDLGDTVHFVERGHVVVQGSRPLADGLTFAVLGPGDYFGDIAVLSAEGRRSATVEALDECVTFVLGGDRFLALRDAHPAMRRLMAESLARMGRRLVDRLLDARHVDARGRLIRQLLRLEELFEGAIPFTQGDLANYVGVTRVTVNQLLGSLADAGLVEIRRGSVQLLDVAGLQAEV